MNVGFVGLRVLNRPWPFEHLAPIVTTTPRVFGAGTRVVGPAHNDFAPSGSAVDLAGVLVIAHDNRNRGADRDAAAQEYRRARRAEGLEL